MRFPALLVWCRRLVHWLAYEWCRLALWLVVGLRFVKSVRSAFRGTAAPLAGPAVRPRRGRRADGRRAVRPHPLAR